MLRIFAVVALLPSISFATVPPPLALGAVEKGKQILTVPAPASLDNYLMLFSPSIRVFDMDREVASNRAEWKAYLIQNAALSVKHRLVSYGNPILAADSVFLPFNGCCSHTRFGVYYLDDDGLVDQINFTEGAPFWDGLSQP